MAKVVKKKAFKIHEAPVLKKAIEESAERMAERLRNNNKVIVTAEEWAEIASIQKEQKRLHEETFPPNPPNELCHHAVIDGILVDNSFLPKHHELNFLMVTPFEKIYVWTARKDNNSFILSEVSQEVHQRNVWRTFGNVLKCVEALYSGFESMMEPEYRWIYRFNNTTDWAEVELIDDDYFKGGVIRKLEYFISAASTIEMLLNNDTFFYAVQNAMAGIENHSFCLFCAYEKEEQRKHKNHEPHIWEYSLLIPKMEIAIVKSTKAVEGILGQQGGSEKKARARWADNVNIDPDEPFMDTGFTYFTYHGYLINEVRNKVAHNLRTKPFKVSRQMTIDAQLYAFDIIKSFYNKFHKSQEEAIKILQLNECLVSRDQRNFATSMTQ